MKTLPLRESDVQRAIMDYLATQGFRVFRRNVAGTIKMEKGGYMKVGVKGQADLWGWHRVTGRHLEIEVKVPGKKPTPIQAEWLAYAKREGCIALWADSVEMVERELFCLYGIKKEVS